MTEPKYNPKTGVWECPICGFRAMSKKVIKAHIQREHPGAASSKHLQDKQKSHEKAGQNGNKKPKNERPSQGQEKAKNNKKREKRHFKVGDTIIEVEKRGKVEIRDQGGWRFFLTANYVATLHKQRVKVKLITGEEFEGRLKARDPYFVGLLLENGEKIYINKAHIVWIRGVGGGDQK